MRAFPSSAFSVLLFLSISFGAVGKELVLKLEEKVEVAGEIAADESVDPAGEELVSNDPVVRLTKFYGYATGAKEGVELAESLLLEEGAIARVGGFIEDLSGSDFVKREKGAAALIGVAAPIDGMLWKAREGADPGLLLMLDRITETRGSLRSLEFTGYLFREIGESKLEGLAVPVARTAEMVDASRDLEVARAGAEAVILTVDVKDADGLRAVMAEDAEKAHMVAVAGLGALAVRDGGDLPEAKEGLETLGLAYALVAEGDGRAVGLLAQLLESESAMLRSEAVRLFDACTEKPELIVGPHDALPKRLEIVAAWAKWAGESDGKPEIKAVTPGGGWQGITLVSMQGKPGAQVTEFGAAGRMGRSFKSGVGGISGTPQGANKLEDGSFLIMTSSGGDSSGLHQFDSSGHWNWSAEGISGTGGFLALANGNFLLGEKEKPVLIEYDWMGAKVGERKISEVIGQIQQLPGGRILAVVQGGEAVVELDSDGAEVWRLGNLEGVNFARRLANGNHLVVHSGGLSEFGGGGEVVWKAENAKSGGWGEIFSAARRVGGNTYLGTDQGLKEITQGSRVLKQVSVGIVNSMESY